MGAEKQDGKREIEEQKARISALQLVNQQQSSKISVQEDAIKNLEKEKKDLQVHEQFFLDLGHYLKLEPSLPVYQKLLRIKPVPADSNSFKIVSNTVRHGKDEYSFTRIYDESQSNHDLCKVKAKKICFGSLLGIQQYLVMIGKSGTGKTSLKKHAGPVPGVSGQEAGARHSRHDRRTRIRFNPFGIIQ